MNDITKLPGQILAWENLTPDWQKILSGSVTPTTKIDAVFYPETVADLASIVTESAMNNWGIIPCGNGTKLGWGDLVKNPLDQGSRKTIALNTGRLNRVIEHAVGDLTVTVEAGLKLADLQAILAKTNQFLPIDPAYPNQATIGGIVATANTGSLRHRYRGIRDLLLGITIARSDGKIAKAGGRVVKNVAGYDLMKLLTGSYGTLGIITQVTFRVYPIPETSKTVILSGKDENLAEVTKILLGSALTPIAVDLISSQLATKINLAPNLSKNSCLLVKFASILGSVEEQASRLLELGTKLELQGETYQGQMEIDLWQDLSQLFWENVTENTVIAKIGVIPNQAVTTLAKIAEGKMFNSVWLHAGSGLGVVKFDRTNTTEVLAVRNWCESQGGFASILVGSIGLKQQVDVWGNMGNAIEIMRKLKQQFDPQNLLNYHRFVGGI